MVESALLTKKCEVDIGNLWKLLKAKGPLFTASLLKFVENWHGFYSHDRNMIIITRHRRGCFRTHDRLGGSDPTPPCYLENRSS